MADERGRDVGHGRADGRPKRKTTTNGFGFLGMLRKYRKRKPLNGIIVTLSVPELAEASSEAAH